MSDADAKAKRIEAYNAAAVAHSTVRNCDRRKLFCINVRNLNNFVKACIIDAAVRVLREYGIERLRVADIACGRGQDIPKWKYAAAAARVELAHFHGIDLAPLDTASAARMAERYNLPVDSVQFETADMGVRFGSMRDASADVVSCQFAVHYVFDTSAHLRTFFSEAARVLNSSTGVLLLSFTDGRAIVKQARAQAAADARGVDRAVVVRRKYYEFEVEQRHLELHLDGVFNRAYAFTLHGSVDNVAEYLCHQGCLEAIARDFGFVKVDSARFDTSANSWWYENTRFRDVGVEMYDGAIGVEDADALETAQLYRWVVFARRDAAACAVLWHRALQCATAPVPQKTLCKDMPRNFHATSAE